MTKKRINIFLRILDIGLILFIIINLCQCLYQYEEEAKTGIGDHKTGVRFDDHVYYANGPITNLNLKEVGDLEEVGVVESYVNSARPKTNNQSNSPEYVGCKIFASPSIPNYIFIQYEGKYVTLELHF